MRFLSFCVVALLAIGVVSGCKSPDRVDQSHATRFAAKAVQLGDRLILLETNGDVWTVDPEGGTAARLVAGSAPGGVVDICTSASGTRLLALVKLESDNFRLEEWDGARWNEGARLSFDSNAERTPYRSLPRIVCDDMIYVLAPEQLMEVSNGKARALPLTPTIEPDFADYHLLPYAGALWVGVNAGEWGGAIRRIDLETGRVQIISSEIWSGICSGPLSAECDAVFALAPSPWHTDCVVASAGSLHMSVKGRLLEICDEQVRRLYFRRLDNEEMWEWIKRDPMNGGEPALTVGFYGFASYKGELVALGFDGIYRFRDSTAPQISPLPKPANIGGFGIARVAPDILLVQSRPPAKWSGKGTVYDGSQFLMVGARRGVSSQ